MDLITTQRMSKVLALKPNETKRVSFRGSYIAILSNSITEDVLVCADSGTSSPVEANTGFPTVKIVHEADGNFKLAPAIYSYVDFTNPNNSQNMEVKYLLSLGTPDDNRTMIRGFLQMDLSAPVLVTMPALDVSTGTFSILPSNTSVKERLVQNNGDYPIWWGDEHTDPDSRRGVVINPGGTAVINCWGAIYFKAQDGDSTLSVVNILKVS